MSAVGPSAPERVDRLIVHQFDAAQPSPGGIDTCIRGILRYAPAAMTLAVIGVDTGSGPPTRQLGHWERHRFGEREVWFLPVARLDPGDQARRIPHSLRLVLGTLKFLRRIPPAKWLQVHRADSAWVLRLLLPRRRLAYFIHTQERGLTSASSDSFWRAAGSMHERLESAVIRRAEKVVVFNLDYARAVERLNPHTVGSPTWFDPAMVRKSTTTRDELRVVWVGRLEEPKDPVLAIRAFAALDVEDDWSLDVLGSGTRMSDVEEAVAALPPGIAARVRLHGRVSPELVASIMAGAGVFLMTSHPGYEGYPRVLVEAMAAGLPAVVTHGSDTGGLVIDGTTGFVVGRDPAEISGRLRQGASLPRGPVRDRVASLAAPKVIERILEDPGGK